jgi:hypothetical protein
MAEATGATGAGRELGQRNILAQSGVEDFQFDGLGSHGIGLPVKGSEFL